jgi:hypothetical protein
METHTQLVKPRTTRIPRIMMVVKGCREGEINIEALRNRLAASSPIAWENAHGF